MNIGIFIENYVAGGSDKIARDLIDNLKYDKLYLFVNKNDNFNILLGKSLPENCQLIKYGIATLPELGLFADSFKKKNKLIYVFLKVSNLIIRYPMMLGYILYFYSKLKKQPVDVFFSNNGGYPGGECNRMATLSASLLGIKNYHIVHNLATFPFFKPYKYIEYFIDWLLSKNTQFICVSQQTKDVLLKRRKISSTPMVIYNGVEKVADKIKNIKPDHVVNLLNIGAIGDRKNQMLIIEALRILKDKGITNFKLTIVGKEEDDGYLAQLQSKINEYGLEDQIRFEGFQSQVYGYYQDSDVFLLSSKVESFALVRVEAMSVGMPVITTDVGDAELQVKHDKNGYIVNNDIEMAHAIEKYLTNSQLIQKHAEYGFDIFLQHFTIDSMIDKYQKLIAIGD